MNLILPLKKDILVDYLRFVFNDSKTGPITVNRNEDVGKYICSMVRSKQLPVKTICPEGYYSVELILPDSTFSTAKNHFLYFTREDIEMINDHLLADFSIFFRRFMLIGDDIGIQQKDLLEAIIAGCRIRINE
ncbi:MAG: hypothetical protein V2A67_12210, partial [Bacteroidota bacterium]